jgi:Transposase DDE domain
MEIISRMATAVESLLGTWADEVAEQTNVVQRQRKFSPRSLASTFVLGFLHKPRASDEDLAHTAALVGVSVSTQAIEQRYHERMVEFMRGLFDKAVQAHVPADRVLAPLLDRFSDVQIMDSTVVSLPMAMADEFPGCGGSHGGTAAMKLQLRLSLKHGCLDALSVEPGRDCDQKTPLQDDIPQPQSLRITDLGYFDTTVFERFAEAKAYWLSPLTAAATVYDMDGNRLKLLTWLDQQKKSVVDCEVLVTANRLQCRLIAWRLPPEIAERRREKCLQRAKKKGRKVSTERLARCEWATLVTNLPAAQLSIDEVRVLYKARWQIELLFKRWKSQGCVAEMTDGSLIRCMVKLWSRLLAAVVQQWLQTGIWGRPEISLKKTWDMICKAATSLAMFWNQPEQLREALTAMLRMAEAATRQKRRKKPSTFELLNEPTKLPYAVSLT